MQKRTAELLSEVKNSGALIHCITNPISINQCANAILALGCRPMMAEHPKEVACVTRNAGALLINLGNITDARRRSAKISARTASKRGVPFVLDAVGVSCLELRRKLALHIIRKYRPDIIKGNYSEIYALYRADYSSPGVDADPQLDSMTVLTAAKCLAQKYGCTVLASGKTDIVASGGESAFLNNGTPRLSGITGTGCMLGALSAAMLSKGNGFTAAAAACALLGICGERAQNSVGSGSFAVALMDALSCITPQELEQNIRAEVK